MTLRDCGAAGARGDSVVVVVVGPAGGVGDCVVVGPAGGAGGCIVARGTVVVGARLCAMDRKALAASTIPPEATRFLRRASSAEVSIRISRMALGTRLGWIERINATSPVTCGAAMEVPSLQP